MDIGHSGQIQAASFMEYIVNFIPLLLLVLLMLLGCPNTGTFAPVCDLCRVAALCVETPTLFLLRPQADLNVGTAAAAGRRGNSEKEKANNSSKKSLEPNRRRSGLLKFV